ncbi:MAG: sigma-70 family RNA polymerase sigma factor [Anaeroplasmataceae bacterium]|nr:sigma-70 family RNA polymerase sigma factor [Anaeroplasmataceae bacterium]
MSKITMKYEFGGKGNFLKIQVEESDIQSQHQIKENNREVWRIEKNIHRHIAKFSLNGDSLMDETSDPLIKRILQEREDCFRKGLALLSEALSNLTPQQREIFQLKEKDGLSFQAIAKAKGITHQVAQRHYQAAIKKLRDFYKKQPFFLEFFPALKGGDA